MLVLKFVKLLKAKCRGNKEEKPELTSEDLEEAELYWIKEVQRSLKCKEKFGSWKQQLSLFEDERETRKLGTDEFCKVPHLA